MSVSVEATLKKNLVKVNHPQSWPWKENGTTFVAAGMILEAGATEGVIDNYFFKKLDFEP